MIERMFSLAKGALTIVDIGAAFFGKEAPYEMLLDNGLGRLFAFEPDRRQVSKLRRHLGDRGHVIPHAVGDGETRNFYVCPEASGMSSLLEPDPSSLGFFNLATRFGHVDSVISLETRRLDDIALIGQIDFLKMDIQGAELMVLKNGRKKLADCVAVQSEISFVPLYRNQPTFGEVDGELRAQGFIPHRFADVKLWSIAPTIRNYEPRMPFNQVLEADLVYIRDMIHPEKMTDLQIKKLAIIAHYIYNSPDLAARCIIELQNRKSIGEDSVEKYLRTVTYVSASLLSEK